MTDSPGAAPLGLDEALRTLHSDDAAGPVVVQAVERLALSFVRTHRAKEDVMLDLAGDLLLRLVSEPIPLMRSAEGFLWTALRNRLLDWLKKRDNRHMSLDGDPARGRGAFEPADGPSVGRGASVDRVVRVGERFAFGDGEELIPAGTLERTLVRLREVANAHLTAGERETLEGLLRIHQGETDAEALAERQRVLLNALEARQSRLRVKLLKVLAAAIEDAADEQTCAELRQLERLVKVLRKRRPPGGGK